jgi:predicted deacylase
MITRTCEVGSASAAPGQKAYGYLKVAELRDGSPVNIPVIIINGVEEGFCLWIEACIHGDEHAGSYALLKITKEISPQKLKGTLIAIPALNITAFQMNERLTPFDTRDLNRVFPGNTEGGFIEQVAYNLYQTIKKAKVDYLIDVHWAGKVDWVLYSEIGKAGDKSIELAKAFGFEVIVKNGHGGLLDGALFNVATRDGIPSIIVESKNIDKLYSGYLNVLRYLKMVEGKPILPKSQKIYQGFVWNEFPMKRGGLFHQKVEEGDIVSKGDLLGIITNIFGEEIDKVYSPVDGLILLAPGNKPLQTGDKEFEIAIIKK